MIWARNVTRHEMFPAEFLSRYVCSFTMLVSTYLRSPPLRDEPAFLDGTLEDPTIGAFLSFFLFSSFFFFFFFATSVR